MVSVQVNAVVSVQVMLARKAGGDIIGVSHGALSTKGQMMSSDTCVYAPGIPNPQLGASVPLTPRYSFEILEEGLGALLRWFARISVD